MHKYRIYQLLCMNIPLNWFTKKTWYRPTFCLWSEAFMQSFYSLFCLVSVMSRVCLVLRLLCLGFVMSRISYVECLLCLAFVSLGFVMSSVCLSRVFTSSVCYVYSFFALSLLCKGFVKYNVCFVKRLLCQRFVLSRVCYV